MRHYPDRHIKLLAKITKPSFLESIVQCWLILTEVISKVLNLKCAKKYGDIELKKQFGDSDFRLNSVKFKVPVFLREKSDGYKIKVFFFHCFTEETTSHH